MDTLISTEGKSGSQSFSGSENLSFIHVQAREKLLLRTDGQANNFRDFFGFLLSDGFFKGNFTERVHGHFNIGEINTSSVSLDSDLREMLMGGRRGKIGDLDSVIDDSFNSN